MKIRIATSSDIENMAALRSEAWGSFDYWINRITGYMNRTSHPHKSKKERIIYVAEENAEIIGLVAGHLTRRYACDGELQWINVSKEHQGKRIGKALLKHITHWFLMLDARRVCVDVDPEDHNAIKFYKSHRATDLNNHWLVWEDIASVLE